MKRQRTREEWEALAAYSEERRARALERKWNADRKLDSWRLAICREDIRLVIYDYYSKVCLHERRTATLTALKGDAS